MYYIGQEIIITKTTRNFKKGDKIIIHQIDGSFLYDKYGVSIHFDKVAPSFAVGDTVWDTYSNTTFVIHQIVDDQVYSITPVGSTDPSFLHGRPIRRVRSGKPLVTPATPHPDTERLDWLLSNIEAFTKYVRECPVTMQRNHRDTIDSARQLGLGNIPSENDGWIPWSGGTCPVRENAFIEYKLRCGSQFKTRIPQSLVWLTHDHGTNPYSIVAYRLVK